MQFIVVFHLLITIWSSSVNGSVDQQPQRAGMQSKSAQNHKVLDIQTDRPVPAFQLLDTLYIDGGRYLNQNGSQAGIEPLLVTVNLTAGFGPTPDPGPVPVLQPNLNPRPAGVPLVSYGFMWSNLIDRAWLFGGQAVDGSLNLTMDNDVWRFTVPQDDSDINSDGGASANQSQIRWTQLPAYASSNATALRPSRGAGCNVPDLQRGYYLGGVTQANGVVQYLHWLHVFDFHNETLSAIPVPSFVPVVNQSLVFLNTGTRSGALAVLGGVVEIDGVISMASLSSVFIFDIESEAWVEQITTSANGTLGPSSSEETDPGTNVQEMIFPRRRMSACAVVGSSQDKTSHNIVLLGGQNNVTAMTETWVLSLPSAIWLLSNFHNAAHTPRAENSCILLNSRVVLMVGGCLMDVNTKQPCLSYSSNPYSWDISDNYPSGYTYLKTGFLLPQYILDKIGGNVSGASSWMQPMFSNFSSALLQDLFTPPYGTWLSGPFFYEQIVLILLTTLLGLPFAVLFIYLLSSLIFRPFLRFTNEHKLFCFPPRKEQQWRPWPFSFSYLLFINSMTLSLIALVILLQYRSMQPDSLVEHWSGGANDTGVWTGEMFESHFIRAPTYDRAPQGLLSVYYDKGTDGVWNQKNSTQRLGPWVYFVFTFLPSVITVLYGRLWKVLDDEVKRVDIYYRLYQPAGAKAKSSLCLNYHSFWTPLSILQALRYRHWAVAISSIGSVLGTIVIPVLGNYVFTWEMYSGAALAWPDTYSWQVALVDSYWTWPLVGALAAALICSLALLCTLPFRETGLLTETRGIAGLVDLLSTNTPIHDALHLGQIDWKDRTLNIKRSINEHIYTTRGDSVNQPITPDQPPVLREKTSGSSCSSTPSWPEIWSCSKPILRLFEAVSGYIENHGNFFVLRPEIFITFWLAGLLPLLVFMGWIAASLDDNSTDEEWNYFVPVNPNIYLIIGVFVQSIVDVIDHAVRALTPYLALRAGYQSPSILWIDYTTGIPLWEVLQAFKRGHGLVCAVMISSLATTVFTILLGSLQLSATSYGSTDFGGDLSAATGATILVAYVFGIYALVAYFIIVPALPWKWTRWATKEVRVLPWPPATLAEQLPYLISSPKLLDDLRSLDRRLKMAEKIKELEDKGWIYGMGQFTNGANEVFGVERLFDAPSAVKM